MTARCADAVCLCAMLQSAAVRALAVLQDPHLQLLEGDVNFYRCGSHVPLSSLRFFHMIVLAHALGHVGATPAWQHVDRGAPPNLLCNAL